ncbi:MAG: DUF1003 domain-containing protein [bacterium]
MEDKKILSLEELKTLRSPVRNVKDEYYQNLTALERVAMWVTDRIGTMGFFLIIFSWTVLWLIWNTLGPVASRFDPYPAFVLWLFISNLIQLHLMPMLLIGQNLQEKHADTRAEADYEINVRAEREIEVIIQHLEAQDKILEELTKKLSN